MNARMKDIMIQNVKIVLLSLLVLGLVVLCILELIPQGGSGIEAREPIRVSSSLIHVTRGIYSCEISGRLYNDTDEVIRIDGIKLKISNGLRRRERVEREVVLEGMELYPRNEMPLSLVWEEGVNYVEVDSVELTVNGKAQALENYAASTSTGEFILLYLVLLVPIALWLVREIKIRYYILQEEHLLASEGKK